MVLPVVGLDVSELLDVYIAAADVDDQRRLGMAFLKELGDHVNGVAIELFDATSRESHGDYAICDVCQVQVVAVFFEAVLGTTNDFS